MGIRVATVNFTKGEISPEVEARFDLDVYHAAARKASNVIIRRTGGFRKRPGSRYVATALSSSSRLVPFQFSDRQAYALELGQAVARPVALGGLVLEPGLKVTGITNANPAKVTCAYHGYSAGQSVWFDGILGMVQVNDRFLSVVQVIDANNFTVNFDATGAGAFISDTGGQANSAPPAAPPAPPAVPAPTPAPTPPPVTNGGSSGAGGPSSPTNGGPTGKGTAGHPVLP